MKIPGLTLRVQQDRVFRHSVASLQQTLQSAGLARDSQASRTSAALVDLNLVFTQTQQSLLFRKKIQLIKEQVLDEEHPLNFLICKFKDQAARLGGVAESSVELCTYINEFVELLFASLMRFYKFRRAQDTKKVAADTEGLLRSQIDLLRDLCKELTLDQEVTGCLVRVIGREAEEQLVELKAAGRALGGWSLTDWKVDVVFQLDAQAYAIEHRI